jgi:hypothetical protein
MHVINYSKETGKGPKNVIFILLLCKYKYIYIYFMEQRRPWEINRFEVSQEIPDILACLCVGVCVTV